VCLRESVHDFVHTISVEVIYYVLVVLQRWKEKKRREKKRGREKEKLRQKKGENRGLWVCLAPSRAACHRWVFLASV